MTSPRLDSELKAYGERLAAWAEGLTPRLVEAVGSTAPWADGTFWSWVVLDREGRHLRHGLNPKRPGAADLFAVLRGSAPPPPEKWAEVTARVQLRREGESWRTAIAELRALPPSAEVEWLDANRFALKLSTGGWSPPATIDIPEPGGSPIAWVLQFGARPSRKRRRELEALGIAVERYVTGHAYLARLTENARRALPSLPDLRAAFAPPSTLPADPWEPPRLPDLTSVPPDKLKAVMEQYKKDVEHPVAKALPPEDFDTPELTFDRELDFFLERLEGWLEEHAAGFKTGADPARRETKSPYRLWWTLGPEGVDDMGSPPDEGAAPSLGHLRRLPALAVPRCCHKATIVVHLGYGRDEAAWGGKLVHVRVDPKREDFIVRHTTAYAVQLKNRQFVPERRVDAAGIRAAAKGARDDRVHFVLQLMAERPKQLKERLDALGVRLFDAATGRCLVASAPSATLEALASVEGVRAAFALLPQDKKGPGVSTGRFDDWALRPNGRVELHVEFHKDVGQAHAEALVRELGGEIAWTTWPARMGVVGPPSLGDAFAEQDLVHSVQQAEPPAPPAQRPVDPQGR